MLVHLVALLSIVVDGAQEEGKVIAEVPKGRRGKKGDVDRYIW